MNDNNTNIQLLDRIRSEQVRSIYRNTAPGLIITNLAAGLVSVTVAWVGAIPWRTVIIFMTVMVIQTSLRLGLFLLFSRVSPPPHAWRKWALWFTVGCAIGGLTLGAGSFFLMPVERFDMQLLVMLLLCAVGSGAVTAFGVYAPAYLAVTVPMLVLPLGWLLLRNDGIHYMLATITVAWLLAITEQARRFSAAFTEAVRLRYENEDLVAGLIREKLVAEEASAAKSRFLAAASHDLRQPVHALSLFVAALRPRVADGEAARLLDHVDSSVQAMGGLFNGLLDISRLDAGVVEVTKRSFAIQPLLERICRDYAAQAEAKNVVLRLKRSRGAVYSDPLLIERVVRNVVANAIAYTDRGRVLVGCRRRGRSMQVQVWDTGRGIPPEEQGQIFQEFYQVANPERDRSRGVGLGLAIVKRLTSLLGHTLSMRSIPARGTVFTLELPLAQGPVTPHETHEPVFDGADGGGGLVLVVDDELEIQIAMKSLLESWGYQVIVAGTCVELLARVSECPDPPALIICDYRLGAHEDGIRVIERLRAEYNDDDIPGMLITGDTAPDRLKEAQASGLLLLHKPVANSRLRAAVTHLVAHPVAPPASHPATHAETSPLESG